MNTANSKWHAIQTVVPDFVEEIATKPGDGGTGRAPIGRPRLAQELAEVLVQSQLEPVWLLAPSRRVGRQWIEILARTGTPVVNLRVTTIRALAYDIASAALARNSLRVAPKRASLILLERILAEHHRDRKLRYFQNPRSLRRLAERMLASLAAIRQAGLHAKDIPRSLGNTPKSLDLGALLARYAADLKKSKLVDQADVMDVALEEAAEGRLPASLKRLLYPEDLDPTPMGRKLLDTLANSGHCQVQKLAVDPPAGPELPVDSKIAPSFSFFRAIGEVNEVRAVFRTLIERGVRLDEVELLHTDSATYPALVQEIVSVLGPAADSDTEVPRPLPVTFAEGLSIRESRPARALVQWLAWRERRYPQSGLVRMVRDRLLSRRTLDQGDEDDPDDAPLDSSSNTPANRVSQTQLLRTLRRLKIGMGLENTLNRIENERTTIGNQPLVAFLPRRRGEDLDQDDVDLDDRTQAYAEGRRQEQIAALIVLEKLAKGLLDCEPPPEPRAMDIIDAALKFLHTFAQYNSEFDGYSRRLLLDELKLMKEWLTEHEEASPRDILEWLQGLPNELVAMGSAPRAGCLHVDSVSGGGHSGRPYTFLLGLDEGRFPGGVGADPVLPDTDRAMLSDQLLLTAQGATRVTEAFWRLLGRLRGQVFLGFSCRNVADQSETFPSPLLLAVYRLTSGHAEATLSEFVESLGRAESFVPFRPEQALNESEWWLSALGPHATAADVRHAQEQHRAHLLRGWEAESARRSEQFTEFDSHVPAAGPILDPRRANGRVASAHSLETLGACARKFFFSYGLELKPLEDLDSDPERWLDAIENGSVMHAVLERFMRRFIDTNERPTVEKHQAQLMEILEEEVQNKRAEKPPADELAFHSRRRELARALRTFLSEEERYCQTHNARPVALEASIGMTPSGPGTTFDSQEPVALRLAGGDQIRVNGRVDRIDLAHPQGGSLEYRIIDYKSGGSRRFKNPGEKAFDKGRRLQHGLYMAMIQHVVASRTDLHPEAVVTRFNYLFPGASAGGERLEWTAEQLSGTKQLVEQLCQIVAAGAFLPTTDSKDCSFCDYQSVCGPTVFQTARQKLEHGTQPLSDQHASLQTLFNDIKTVGRAEPAQKIFSNNPPPLEPVLDPLPGDPEDQIARKAIRENLHTSMLVEASAGTGKTTCMVDRMLSLVQTGTARASDIAAITFTRKSAAELRRRFREALEHRLRKAKNNPEFSDQERKNLGAALEHGEGLVIGTVHSFCGRLLRERPIEAGIDPAAEELDPGAEATLRNRAWREFCELVPLDGALSEHLKGLELAGLELRDLRPAFDMFVEHADVELWPAEPVEPPDVAELLHQTCRAIEQTLEPSFRPWDERGSDAMMGRLETILRRYRNRLDDSRAELMAVAEEFEGNCPTIIQKAWWPEGKAKERKERLEQWWDSQVQTFASSLQAWRAHRYQFAVPLLRAASHYYSDLRLNLGKVSFVDLLGLTARLLKNSQEARHSFQKRYPFLLVDEFQDTDPIQAEILLLLTAREASQTDWQKCTPRSGSLFVVGDPKQSIYRFRRADIGTYETVKQQILASGGQVQKLTTNFRTNSGLVQWVNQSFEAAFARHRGNPDEPYGPDFTPSAVGRLETTAGLLAGTRLLRVSKGGTELEAQTVARFIRCAIEQKLTVPRTQSEVERGVSLECRPEDFLIVTYDTTELSTYAVALNAQGVPVDVTGRKGADHAETLSMLRMCLQLTVDADDPVAALAVLRGPVFGFTDRELHQYKRAGYRIDGRFHRSGKVEAPMAEDLAARFEDAARLLARWRRFAHRLPVAAAVERIVDDAGLFLVAAAAGEVAGSQGRGAGGVLASFIERVRAERDTLTSLQDVVDRIDELVSSSPNQDFDTLSLDVGSGGAVRVMNLHKVKGLEAPVVFLCEEAQDKNYAPSWHIARTDGVPQGYLKITRSHGPFSNSGKTVAAPLDWAAWEAIEANFLNAEKSRLQYVAATRPGTCLVVSVFEDDNEKGTGGWLELARNLEGTPCLPLPAADEPALTQAQGRTGERRPNSRLAGLEDGMYGIQARIRELCRATYASVRPRDFLTEASEALKNAGRGLGQEWGTVIHRLLELAADNTDRNGTLMAGFDLETVAHNVVQETLLDEDADHGALVENALSLVREVMASEIWKLAQASPRAYREAPFTVQLSAKELPGFTLDAGPLNDLQADQACEQSVLPTLIHGVIDLVFEDARRVGPNGTAGWTIVDWKTSNVGATGKEIEAYYRPQVQLYARCWAAVMDSLGGRNRSPF